MLYFRAVYANKFTLAGYVFLGAFLVLFILSCFVEANSYSKLLDVLLDIIWWVAYICLILTGFGVETTRACLKTLRHLKIHGLTDERFGSKYRLYCGKAGYRLAIKIWEEERAIKSAAS